MREHQRRTYLVDRSFQLKYIVLLMAWGAVLAALFGLWIYQAHQQALDSALLQDPALRAAVQRGERQLLWALGGICALSAAALGLLGFIVTHRVAGPVYVMGHYLAVLAQGRYPQRRALRRGDELKGFHAHLLEVLDELERREARTLGLLESAVAHLRGAAGGAPALAAAASELEREVSSRREALAQVAGAGAATARGL
jgi:hypothetical protein